MKFRIRYADQLVGLFLLLAVLAIAVILVFLGVNQRWFAKDYEFRSRFDSAGGLSVGMPIMLKGFEIGSIERIELNDDNQVDVLFTVQDTYYSRVLPNSVLELTSSPIGLGVTLNFYPGAGAGMPQPELSFIPSLDLPEGQDLVTAGLVVIPKGEDVIGSVIAKLNPILDDVRSTIVQIKRVVGTVDLALQGKSGPVGEMVMDLSTTPDKVNALIDDVNARVAGIGMISAEYGNGNTRVARGQNGTEPYVTGVEPVYGAMRNIDLEPGGRFLDPLDLDMRRRVVVLGDGIKKLLFDAGPAVGQTVQIGDSPFLVIGVMQHKTQNSSYSSRDENRVFIPASTYRALFGTHYPRNIVSRPAVLAETGAVRQQVYEVLARRHVFDATDTDAIMVWDTNDMLRMVDNLFSGFTIFLGIVGSFTLAVGGIGVANIMYIVVRERTPEIGLKRSIGARRRDILGQFLLETTLVVAVGAVLGLLISAGLVALGRLLPIQEAVGTPSLSPAVVGITVLLLGGISFLAGIFPAWRAAHLDPVQCLRA